MHMLITPMRNKGIALSPTERRSFRAIRSDVQVVTEPSTELGAQCKRRYRIFRFAVGVITVISIA